MQISAHVAYFFPRICAARLALTPAQPGNIPCQQGYALDKQIERLRLVFLKVVEPLIADFRPDEQGSWFQ